MQGEQPLIESNPSEEPAFTFRIIAKRWAAHFAYLLSCWRILLIASCIGGLLGLLVSWLKPVTFSARLSFVVEESKQAGGGGSLVSALAGQFGFDVGGMTGSSGMLAGDNVLELLKSRSLIKKTLLTPYTKDSAGPSLADQFAIAYELKEKWRNSSKVGRQVDFPANKTHFTRLEDSLLQRIIKVIFEEELSISKPDKKLNFFEINYNSRDEKLSQLFCERLLKIASDFYIETKTRRLRSNIYRLQQRADSLGLLLDLKTYSAAKAAQGLIDINPVYSSEAVSAEISSRNKLIQGTIYGEIVKNLEVSKTSLIQETPTVQIVDYPELPLKRNRLLWYVGLVVGAALVNFITALYLISARKTPKED